MSPGVKFNDPTVFTLTRTTAASANPTTIEQRSNAFATSVSACAFTTLLMARDSSGIKTFVVMDGPAEVAGAAALTLAQAVGARADRIEEVPEHLTVAPELARMVVHSTSAVARQNVVGTDPNELARLMSVQLRDGDWVAVTMRDPSEKESLRNQEWIQARLTLTLGTHHSQSRDARVISIWSGSSSSARAKSLLSTAASAMQGFDLKVKAERISPMRGARGWFGAAGAGLAYTVAATATDVIPVGGTVGGVTASVLIALVGLARLLGRRPTLFHHAVGMVAYGLLPRPAHRLRRPTPPREESTDRNGKRRKARQGDYPLHKSAFLVAPSIFVGLASPHAGTDAGAASTQKRTVPKVFTQRIGPLIGFDDETPAHLSAAAAWSGVAILGRPGSGKSVMTRSLFGWACMDRAHPSGAPSTTGARNTLVVFESKDYAAVERYTAWAGEFGEKTVVVDMVDEGAYAIDMFAGHPNISAAASAFVNAMVYAFDKGDIQNRSFVVLERIFTGALAIAEDRTLAELVDGVDSGGSVLHFANVLVGNLGDPRAAGLAKQVLNRAKQPGATVSHLAGAEALAYLFDGRTEAQRRTLVEAAQNKVSQLAHLESWWSPSRRKITWDQVLSASPKHRAVIINTGASKDEVQVEDKLTQLMSSLLMYTLQRAIKKNCPGWEEQGRSVSIYSDELSLLAGTNEEIITWLKDQGRSFGVRPVLATQRPEQLPPAVRKLVLNFGTLVCFNQDSVATAEEVAREMSGADGAIEAAEIMHLPDYHAMVRAYYGKERQPAFTVKAYDFESDRAKSAQLQGYDFAAAAADAGLVDAPVVAVAADLGAASTRLPSQIRLGAMPPRVVHDPARPLPGMGQGPGQVPGAGTGEVVPTTIAPATPAVAVEPSYLADATPVVDDAADSVESNEDDGYGLDLMG